VPQQSQRPATIGRSPDPWPHWPVGRGFQGHRIRPTPRSGLHLDNARPADLGDLRGTALRLMTA
jgi:hypothetical protein